MHFACEGTTFARWTVIPPIVEVVHAEPVSLNGKSLFAAAVLGAGGGLRSFAPPAVLAARGSGPLAGAARFIAFGAATGELIADKQPDMGNRVARRGLTLRLGFSSSAGHELAGFAGAAVAGSAALATAWCGSQLRSRIGGGGAGLVAAVGEDLVSYALVIAATGPLEAP